MAGHASRASRQVQAEIQLISNLSVDREIPAVLTNKYLYELLSVLQPFGEMR